jgi:hypothetical protein
VWFVGCEIIYFIFFLLLLNILNNIKYRKLVRCVLAKIIYFSQFSVGEAKNFSINETIVLYPDFNSDNGGNCLAKNLVFYTFDWVHAARLAPETPAKLVMM